MASGTLVKVVKTNIKGKIFTVIHNMYKNIKTCIKQGKEYSVFFNSDMGVKQGENLSHFYFLFS